MLGTPSTQKRSFTATGTPPSAEPGSGSAGRLVGHPQVGAEIVGRGPPAPELEQLGGRQLAVPHARGRLGGRSGRAGPRSRAPRAGDAEPVRPRVRRGLQSALRPAGSGGARPRAARSRSAPRAWWAPRPPGRATPSARCGRGSAGSSSTIASISSSVRRSRARRATCFTCSRSIIAALLRRGLSRRRPSGPPCAARVCPRRSCARPRATSTAKRSLRPSATSFRRAVTAHTAPSAAAPTCLMHTSKPTVAWPSGRCSKASTEAQRSIIAIIPGVESTFTGSVPPTSVRSRSSTVNSSRRSMPGRERHAPLAARAAAGRSSISGGAATGRPVASVCRPGGERRSSRIEMVALTTMPSRAGERQPQADLAARGVAGQGQHPEEHQHEPDEAEERDQGVQRDGHGRHPHPRRGHEHRDGAQGHEGQQHVHDAERLPAAELAPSVPYQGRNSDTSSRRPEAASRISPARSLRRSIGGGYPRP